MKAVKEILRDYENLLVNIMGARKASIGSLHNYFDLHIEVAQTEKRYSELQEYFAGNCSKSSPDLKQEFEKLFTTDATEVTACPRLKIKGTPDEIFSWFSSKLAEREKQELYCVVLWLNGNPILDGMPYFQTKDRAIEYAREQEKYAEQHPEFNATYTIISIKLESERDKK